MFGSVLPTRDGLVFQCRIEGVALFHDHLVLITSLSSYISFYILFKFGPVHQYCPVQ